MNIISELYHTANSELRSGSIVALSKTGEILEFPLTLERDLREYILGKKPSYLLRPEKIRG